METFIHADIFFFVTTLCVILISVTLAVFLIRLSMFTKALHNMAEELREKAGDIGDEAEEMLERIKDSFVYRLVFGGGKKKSKKPVRPGKK